MNSRLSDFEAGWGTCPHGHALSQHRQLAYDRYSALTYAPADFLYQAVELSDTLPTFDWTASNFLSFVRGEFGDPEQPVAPYPGMPDISHDSARIDIADEYLERSEQDLVYTGYLDALLRDVSDDMTDAIYSILGDDLLGHRRNRTNVNREALSQSLQPLLESRHRIRLVMPAFPFKDQNPFRTRGAPRHPDLGEVALLIRLHVLALALYQVHPHGVDWILVGDGRAYGDIFGVPEEEASAYQAELRRWRNHLNLHRTVSVVDLADLVERADTNADGTHQGSFSAARQQIREHLERLRSQDEERALGVLRRGMAWNLNTRDLLDSGATHEALWTAVRTVEADHADATSRALHTEVRRRAHTAALDYASFNLALRYHDLIDRFLPGAIRATIHPKPGQIAAPSLGKVFPWNGVPLLTGSVASPDSIQVDALIGHGRRHASLVEHSGAGGRAMYYSVGEK